MNRGPEPDPREAPAPAPDCALCPRLVAFREANREAHADWHNAPVASFGDVRSRLLVVGLAPGLRGANRTGRPFTGDFAGELLYPTLMRFGFARGSYGAHPEDGLELVGCRITNAVRCVPPANKPTGAEARSCRRFLQGEIEVARPEIVLALGVIAHNAVLASLNLKRSHWRFGHGAFHALPRRPVLADSYHCSRYNVNTRRLTEAMFHEVFEAIRRVLKCG